MQGGYFMPFYIQLNEVVLQYKCYIITSEENCIPPLPHKLLVVTWIVIKYFYLLALLKYYFEFYFTFFYFKYP